MQEVALNENCWVYLGQLSPVKMLEFTVMLWDVEGYINKRWEAMTQLDLEYLYRVSFKRGSPATATTLHSPLRSRSLDTDQENFEQTLKHLIGKKAKIPLDVIFAYRALFPESIGQIRVSYKRDLIDVLREVTVQILPYIRKLGDLLDVVSHCPGIPGAPSWTLNFTCGEHVYNAAHYFGVWRATKINCPITHRVSSDSETLHVNGIIVDRVAAVSDEFPPYALENQAKWHKEVRDVLTQWRVRSQGSLNIGFEESIINVLFAAVNVVEDFANKFGQYNRLEQVCSNSFLCLLKIVILS